MIPYKIGDVECNLDWETFLVLETLDSKYYKSDFKSFSEMYEYIDKNIKEIKLIRFDNNEFHLKNGVLHNLWGPASIIHNISGFQTGIKRRFYIHGRIVNNSKGVICKKENDFKEGIHFHEEITGQKTHRLDDGTYYRRKEGVDYKKHHINLEQLREKELRKLKIESINHGKKI